MRPRTFLAIVAVFALMAGAILWWGETPLPDRWNPVAPIHLVDKPNFLTARKLQRLNDKPARCHALLARAGFEFVPLPDRVVGDGCGFHNTVRIEGSEVSYGRDFTASCPLAVGLALLELHSLQPAARAAFGAPVVRVEHYGSYACRNVNNRNAGPRSEHATANAMDIKGFRLRDGRRITVKAGWNDAGAEGVFLRRIRDDACTIFKGVLGPDHDAAHADHFHVDMGSGTFCR